MQNDFFSQTVIIPEEVCEPGGLCTLPYLLKQMEQAAFSHSEQLGQSPETLLRDYGIFWMLFYSDLSVYRLPRLGEALTVKTRYLGIRGATVQRDYSLWVSDREVLSCLQSWVVVRSDTRTLAIPGNYPVLATENPAASPKRRRKFCGDVSLQKASTQAVGPEDLDFNGHMNNVRYVRHALALLPGVSPEGCRVQLLYRNELLPGQTYDCLTGAWETTRQVVFRRGDTDCFQMELSPLSAT